MADHPCDLGPPLVVALDPEEVDVEVQVGLHVLGVHAGEAPEVSLEPRAEVVHQLHRLEVRRVADVRLVRLVLEQVLPDQDPVGALSVVHEGGALGDVAAEGGPYAGRRRLPVPADHRDGLLSGVDAHGDAQLVLGKPAPPGPTALRQPDVVDVYLVDPDAAPQHDAVLVALHRGEQAVAPLPGGLVADAAGLGARVERRREQRQPDEGHPGGERLLAVLEDGSGQRREPRPARAAPPPLEPGRRGAVAAGAPFPAFGAGRVRPVQLGGLGERAEAELLAEPALLDGVGQVLELGGRQRPDEPGVGVLVLHGGIVPSARTPTRRDCRQTKIRVGARAHSLFGTHKDSAVPRTALSITQVLDC